MAKFKYSALDKDGRESSGVIESTSESRARKELSEQGLTVSRLTEVAVQSEKKAAAAKKQRKPIFGTGVTSENVTIFSRQLATLLKAGLPLLRSLEVIGRQEKNPYFKDIVENLADAVRTGNKFSDGLQQHPKVFDKLYVNMARAGEAGGVLDVVLDRLATFQEKAMKTTNKVKSAMVYPIVILTVAVAIVVILMIFVVPQFQKIFSDMLNGAPMPALTQGIINISDFMKENYIATLGIVVAVIAAFKIFFKTKVGQRLWDIAGLKLPKFGDLVMKSTVARFTRTFGTLLASGVPILEALNITRGTIKNSVISDALVRVHDRVRDGGAPRRSPRPAEDFPHDGDEHGRSRRRNGAALRNAQPHCGQLRRRSRQRRRRHNVCHRTYHDCLPCGRRRYYRYRPLPPHHSNYPKAHRRLRQAAACTASELRSFL